MTARRTRFARASALALVLASTAAIVVACESKTPTNADVASMDAASATFTAKQAGVLSARSEPAYYVNGELAASDQANKIPASEIATVRVDKSADNGRGAIFITTVSVGKERRPMTGEEARAQRVSEGALRKVASEAGKETQVQTPTGEMHMRTPEGFTGVVYIDGKKSSIEGLRALDAKTIETVDVLKGAAAAAAYGPDAANGAIVVVTKRK